MRIRRVTYDLGNVIERQEYLDGRYGAPGEKRAKKKKATPEEVEQVNQWTRERKARHRLRMYFKVNDYFFTLTYPKEERPSDMKQAKQDFKEFYLFCKKEYKKRGQELRWIRNIECTPSGNWHVHVVLNRIPDTDLIIAAAWKHGLMDMWFKDMVHGSCMISKMRIRADRIAISLIRIRSAGTLDSRIRMERRSGRMISLCAMIIRLIL